MSSVDDYRTNAEDCLRMANTAVEERDRPLWATMAQSWLRLAEHAARTVPMAGPAAVEAAVADDHVECVSLAPEQAADSESPPTASDAVETAVQSPGTAH